MSKTSAAAFAGGFGTMFTPYSQRSGDKIDLGLGLGLSIAKENVETDGGVLTEGAVPGTGCVFPISPPHHALR